MGYIGVVPCASQIFAESKQTVAIRRREGRLLISFEPSKLLLESTHGDETLVPPTFKLRRNKSILRV